MEKTGFLVLKNLVLCIFWVLTSIPDLHMYNFGTGAQLKSWYSINIYTLIPRQYRTWGRQKSRLSHWAVYNSGCTYHILNNHENRTLRVQNDYNRVNVSRALSSEGIHIYIPYKKKPMNKLREVVTKPVLTEPGECTATEYVKWII